MEEDADAKVDVQRYSNQDVDPEVENQRPATPSTPEHNCDHDDHHQADFHGGADSLDDDSSSDYINNTSDDEEDYDDGEFDISSPIIRVLRVFSLAGILKKKSVY